MAIIGLCKVCNVFPSNDNDRKIPGTCGKCYYMITENVKAAVWQLGVAGEITPPDCCLGCGCKELMAFWNINEEKPFNVTKVYYGCMKCQALQTAWPRIQHEKLPTENPEG